MSSREKTLALVVGSLAPIFILFFAFLWFMDRYEGNEEEIDDLTAQVEAQETKKMRGMAASQRQGYYRKVSLPVGTSRARSIYKTWLDDLVLKESGMSYDGVRFKEGGEIAYEGEAVATRNAFTVKPRGTLQQLVAFLHGFYSADHLHRINKLTIKPVTKSNRGKDPILTGELQMEVEIETLSLVDGPVNIVEFPVWRRELPAADDYTRNILSRNIFGPANNLPSFEKPKRSDLEFTIAASEKDAEGKYETVQIEAADADADDLLAFELIEKSGDDSNVKVVLGDQPRTASYRKMRLRIPKQTKPVRIPVSMRVVDDGLPSKSDEINFTISFVAPEVKEVEKPKDPPKPIEFAEHTYVRGLMSGGDGRWVVMLFNQIKSESHKLAAGDTVDIDGLTWTVIEVSKNLVTFEVDGDEKTFESGRSLADPLKAL
ncbi:hypothetical protein [Mariniblastus fucicola]|nr:hypothetical protein [Mariniblastus fucicola]